MDDNIESSAALRNALTPDIKSLFEVDVPLDWPAKADSFPFLIGLSHG
jgi:hypothetical protein